MRSVSGGQVELEVPRAPQGETVGFVGLDPGVWWGGAVRGADSVMKPWGEWAPSWERAEGVREGDTLSQRAGGQRGNPDRQGGSWGRGSRATEASPEQDRGLGGERRNIRPGKKCRRQV